MVFIDDRGVASDRASRAPRLTSQARDRRRRPRDCDLVTAGAWRGKRERRGLSPVRKIGF